MGTAPRLQEGNPVEDAPGDNTAGIDLGISNYLAINYEDGPSELYPGNTLKADKHYFTRNEYQTEEENGPSKRALKARQKLSRRKDRFFHTLSKHIVKRCIEEGVEKIAVGDLSDIREDDNGDSRDWGRSRNKKLHGWEFDRFTRLLEYKAEEHGILVDRVDEENTSKRFVASENTESHAFVRVCRVGAVLYFPNFAESKLRRIARASEVRYS